MYSGDKLCIEGRVPPVERFEERIVSGRVDVGLSPSGSPFASARASESRLGESNQFASMDYHFPKHPGSSRHALTNVIFPAMIYCSTLSNCSGVLLIATTMHSGICRTVAKPQELQEVHQKAHTCSPQV